MMKVVGRKASLALLGLALAVSISGVYIGLALYLGFLITSSAGRKSFKWNSTPLDLPLLVLFVWCVLVAGFKDQYPLLFFYLLAHAASDMDVETLLRWFLIGSVLAGLVAVLQMSSGIVYNPTPNTYVIPA